MEAAVSFFCTAVAVARADGKAEALSIHLMAETLSRAYGRWTAWNHTHAAHKAGSSRSRDPRLAYSGPMAAIVVAFAGTAQWTLSGEWLFGCWRPADPVFATEVAFAFPAFRMARTGIEARG